MKKDKALKELLDEMHARFQEINQKLDHLIRRLRQFHSNHDHNNHLMD